MNLSARLHYAPYPIRRHDRSRRRNATPRDVAGACSTAPRLIFHLGLSGTLLMIVGMGFMRTLYLRSMFDVPAIPPSLIAHGVILTAWVVGYFAQTALIATHQIAIHRRLGWALTFLTAGVGIARLVRDAQFFSTSGGSRCSG